MRCLFTLVLSTLLLAACTHQPPPPDWLLTARSAGEQHARFYLEGRDRLAQSQLQTDGCTGALPDQVDRLRQVQGVKQCQQCL